MRGQKLQIVQYLRGIAAMMVVFHHAKDDVDGWCFDPIRGFTGSGAGVDIFFVISGVVMYASARGEPPIEFLRRRIIRIVPLYWAATTAWLFLLLRHRPDLATTASHYLLSLLFVPYVDATHGGMVWPLLIPGWTLNFEMFFYLLFAAGLLLGRLVPFLVASVALLALLGMATDWKNAALVTYTSPLLIDFLAGVLLARLLPRRWPRWLALLLPLGFAVILFVDVGPEVIASLIRASVGSILVVAGALAIERNGFTPQLSAMTRLGDASYATYLSHSFTLIAADKLAERLPLAGWPQFIAYMTLALAASAVVGELTFRWVERPLTRFAGRLWPGSKPVPA